MGAFGGVRSLEDRRCVSCGDVFTASSGNQVTCGPICSAENKRARKRECDRVAQRIRRRKRLLEQGKRRCEVCLDPFQPSKPAEKTCSPICYADRFIAIRHAVKIGDESNWAEYLPARKRDEFEDTLRGWRERIREMAIPETNSFRLAVLECVRG